MNDIFRKVASKISQLTGTSWAFIIALLIIVVWFTTGPMFGFSDTWQLIINTGTTIVTFLMVFLIQNTQNRDSRAVHLKLDELISATKKANNMLVDIEEESETDLDKLGEHYKKIREKEMSKK